MSFDCGSAMLRSMAYSSFRQFVDALEEAGELTRIAAPVDTDLLIAEWANREMKSPNGGKALLFEKPTIDGKASPFPLAINTMGSRRRMLAVGDMPPPITHTFDMRDVTAYDAIIDAFEMMLDTRNNVMRVVGPAPNGGEYIGLLAAVQRYGIPYSSLRAWVRAGIIPSWRTPNRRIWLRPSDIEQKLFQPNDPPTTGDETP